MKPPDFEGRQVLVTGGAGALGSAVLELLLEAGAVCRAPIRAAENRLGLEHESLEVVTGVDLTDEEAVRRAYDGLPVLWASIHCAGGFAMDGVQETSLRDFEGLLAMNAVATFLCSREAVRCMRQAAAVRRPAPGGRIVNVAAQPALEPRRGAGMTAYTASKAAVAAFTEALAEELAPEGIWVNAVAPSILDTEANRVAMPKADFSRWPKVREVAATIAFLASPLNEAARGSVVRVYGKS